MTKLNIVKEFKILDLFCGAGGFSYGMHKNIHFKTAVAVDFNEKAAHTFKMNMPNTYVIHGDLRNAETKADIVKRSKAAGVNMIIGGPPCQGFSMKGKKLGLKDERNFLFLEYLNLVKDLQPEVFVIENVKSLLSTAGGWFRDEILSYIGRLGYKVNYGVLNAKNFGVPQSRERAIFICSKQIDIPLPIGDDNIVTVRDAISDLAYLTSGEGDFESDYITEPKSDYQRLMREGSTKLYNHKASNHSSVAIKKLAMIPPEKGKEYLPDELKGKQKFNTTWGRLSWDKVSPTIDTRFDTPSNGTNSHPELHRAITPREAARIQSFDDKFIFHGSKLYIRTQIGNAVPPLLGKAIADAIWNTYDDHIRFEKNSDNYENSLNDDYKKEHGIFYTDLELSRSVVKFLHIPTTASCIDPCCGAGSFVHMMHRAGVKDVYGCDFDLMTVSKCKELTGLTNIFCVDTIGREGKEVLDSIGHEAFDYLVGNPPYAPMVNDVTIDGDKKFVKLVTDSGNNLYIGAIYRTFELVKPEGIVSIVIPKNLLHISSYKKLRQRLLKDKTILSIIELGIHFKTVRGEQIVLTFMNKPTMNGKIKYYTYDKGIITYMSEVPQSFYSDEIIVFTSNLEVPIYNKLKDIKPKMKSVCKIPIRRGHSTDSDAVRGKQIRKYGLREQDLPTEGNQVFIQNIFSAESGIIATFGGNRKAAETVTIATLPNTDTAKYVLGLLHSRLCNYFLIRFAFNNSRLTIHTDAQYLNTIPVITNTLFYYEVIEIVKKMERAEYMSDVWFNLNEELNEVVYSIYGLLPKEKMYVETEIRKIHSMKWFGSSKSFEL